jgi:hypothetical protein
MKNPAEFIKSGILETYVLGIASEKEILEVERMAESYSEIKNEINSISIALEDMAMANAITPPPTVKPFLRAILDFTERMEKGEKPSAPPILNALSKLEDYKEWLERPDLLNPAVGFEDVYAKIIGYTPEAISAIVWIREAAPYEVHDDEFEKFLIVEGTCDIIIGDDTHHLVAGDYLSIPLFKNHMVKVTSDIPCKVILQRIAA